MHEVSSTLVALYEARYLDSFAVDLNLGLSSSTIQCCHQWWLYRGTGPRICTPSAAYFFARFTSTVRYPTLVDGVINETPNGSCILAEALFNDKLWDEENEETPDWMYQPRTEETTRDWLEEHATAQA